VLVDLRPGSATYGKWEAMSMKGNDGWAVWCPAGVAHGYLACEDNTIALYHKGGVFDATGEIGVNPFDPAIGIEWPFLTEKLESDLATGSAAAEVARTQKSAVDVIVSEKDRNLPLLKELIAAGHPKLAAQKKVWYAPNKFEAYGDEEMFAVAKCLRDGWLAPGPQTEEFQRQVLDLIDVRPKATAPVP